MRQSVRVFVLLAGSLTASCGGSTTAPSSARNRAFTVMTFNVQHGLDFSGKYDLQRAADTIASLSPDLVAVQEVTRNHPSYGCDDQPRLIAQRLEQATARSWRYIYQQQWFTPDRSCADTGRGDGPETEGLAFFAPQSIGGETSVALWNGAIGYAANTPTVPTMVIATHLASGLTFVDDRTRQLAQLLPWARSIGVPRILLGDFNTRPDTPELQPVFAEYRDAWADALAAGLAHGVTTGDTRIRGGRIDYVFYVGDTLRVLDAQIVDTTASDHRPVVIRFGVS